jgi:hypothetical protein
MNKRVRERKSDTERNDAIKALRPAAPDHLAALARAVAGVAPYIGGAIGELVTYGIPNQRIDRIIQFVEVLDKMVAHLGQEVVRAQLTNENFTDVLEEGLAQAARSLTDQRREYIAFLLAAGLSKDEVDYSQTKHLLRILGEINDVEVIILRSYVGRDVEFLEKHRAVLKYEPAHIGSSVEVVDNEAIQTNYREHLANLGLLSRRFNLSARTAPFGNTLDIKGYDITWLGRLLLRYVGISPEKAEKEVESRVEINRADPPT